MEGWKIVGMFLLLGVYVLQAQEESPFRQPDSWPSAYQHEDEYEYQDTLPSLMPSEEIHQKTDSMVVIKQDTDRMTMEKQAFKPDPKKTVILSAIFPGLGQIYNRKYWKLPILYGGFIGFSYAISWNNRYYQDYFQGYKDIMDDDPETNSWHKFLRYGQDPETVDTAWLKDVLKRGKNYYRRYRDLSIIGTVALYGLSIMDAYVDAQLFDFDISPDLSMQVEPTVIERNNYYTANTFGIRCSFNF